MQIICTKHQKDIHRCVERIINTFKQDMIRMLRHEDQEPPITVSCGQVDTILVHAAYIAHRSSDHMPEWQAGIYNHRPGIACGKCGIVFTNRVIEEARRLGVL